MSAGGEPPGVAAPRRARSFHGRAGAGRAPARALLPRRAAAVHPAGRVLAGAGADRRGPADAVALRRAGQLRGAAVRRRHLPRRAVALGAVRRDRGAAAARGRHRAGAAPPRAGARGAGRADVRLPAQRRARRGVGDDLAVPAQPDLRSDELAARADRNRARLLVLGRQCRVRRDRADARRSRSGRRSSSRSPPARSCRTSSTRSRAWRAPARGSRCGRSRSRSWRRCLRCWPRATSR